MDDIAGQRGNGSYRAVAGVFCLHMDETPSMKNI